MGEIKDTGREMLHFCTANRLCVGNTFLSHRGARKLTFRRPGAASMQRTHKSAMAGLDCLDYILVRRQWLSALQDVWVCRRANPGWAHNDHHPVLAKVRLHLRPPQPRRLQQQQEGGRQPRPDRLTLSARQENDVTRRCLGVLVEAALADIPLPLVPGLAPTPQQPPTPSGPHSSSGPTPHVAKSYAAALAHGASHSRPPRTLTQLTWHTLTAQPPPQPIFRPPPTSTSPRPAPSPHPPTHSLAPAPATMLQPQATTAAPTAAHAAPPDMPTPRAAPPPTLTRAQPVPPTSSAQPLHTPTLRLPPVEAAFWLLAFLVFLAPKLLIASIPVSHLPLPLRLAVTYTLPGLALGTLFHPFYAGLLATLALALLAALPHLITIATTTPTLASNLASQLKAHLASRPEPPPELPPQVSPTHSSPPTPLQCGPPLPPPPQPDNQSASSPLPPA